jgi:hypothetical protein
MFTVVDPEATGADGLAGGAGLVDGVLAEWVLLPPQPAIASAATTPAAARWVGNRLMVGTTGADRRRINVAPLIHPSVAAVEGDEPEDKPLGVPIRRSDERHHPDG